MMWFSGKEVERRKGGGETYERGRKLLDGSCRNAVSNMTAAAIYRLVSEEPRLWSSIYMSHKVLDYR
jgi:hypothetical protein